MAQDEDDRPSTEAGVAQILLLILVLLVVTVLFVLIIVVIVINLFGLGWGSLRSLRFTMSFACCTHGRLLAYGADCLTCFLSIPR